MITSSVSWTSHLSPSIAFVLKRKRFQELYKYVTKHKFRKLFFSSKFRKWKIQNTVSVHVLRTARLEARTDIILRCNSVEKPRRLSQKELNTYMYQIGEQDMLHIPFGFSHTNGNVL